MADTADCASYLEINASHLRHNLSIFRTMTSGRLGVVLKANAYGHGLVEVLKVVHSEVDIIFVISPVDAQKIRSEEVRLGLSRKRVLVIGAVSLDEAIELSLNDVEVTIGDLGWLSNLTKAKSPLKGKKIVSHVHIDTGLSREGFLPERIPSQLSFLKTFNDVFEIRGAFSHFANTEDVTEQAYALEQLASFERGISQLNQLLAPEHNLERHFAASAASLVLPPARYDILRVGISLYGLWPSAETKLSAKIVLGEPPKLKPVLTWKVGSQIIKQVPAGTFVGYGCTHRCEQDSTIAVFPVGYFDGYPRLLSSRSHVLIRGRRCPVIGRVMMNHIVVDVSGLGLVDLATPLLAVLMGSDGKESVSAEQLGTWASTINYEIVARLGEHLERRVVE